MTIHEQIKAELKTAMKDKNTLKLAVARGLLAAFTNELVAKRRKPDESLADADALAVIKRAARQRQDAIEQFRAGGRADLVASETAELAFLQTYLPATMSRANIRQLAEKKLVELGGTETNQGKIIGALMKELHGQADGADVKAVVEEVLGK